MSKLVEPKQVMTFLNQLFTKFDKLVDVFGVQKVETAGEELLEKASTVSLDPSYYFTPAPGDCYIAACGILADEDGFSVVGENHNPKDSAQRVMAFAKSIMQASKEVR